jgi:hypothetical protein
LREHRAAALNSPFVPLERGSAMLRSVPSGAVMRAVISAPEALPYVLSSASAANWKGCCTRPTPDATTRTGSGASCTM